MTHQFTRKRTYLLTTALLGFAVAGAGWGVISTPAHATTYEKTTTTTQITRPGARQIDFAQLDRNNDGILSKNEIGNELFYLFDTDNNEVLDNREIADARIYTVIPLEQQTTFVVDFDDDGIADMAEVSSDTFLQQTELSRFADGDKLSAEGFVDQSFLQLDKDDSKVVERREWVAAYNDLVDPYTEATRYNQ